MAGDIAALEPAVERMAVGGGGGDFFDRFFKRRIEGAAIAGAKVKCWQPPLEKAGQDGADGVAIIEQHIAVPRLDPLDLLRQHIMIGLPEDAAPRLDFFLVRLQPVEIQLFIIK